VWPFLLGVPALSSRRPSPLLKRGAPRPRAGPEDHTGTSRAACEMCYPPARVGIADSPALTPTERVMLLAGAAGAREAPMREFARAYTGPPLLRASAGVGVGHVSSGVPGGPAGLRTPAPLEEGAGGPEPRIAARAAREGRVRRKAEIGKALRGRLRGSSVGGVEVYGRRCNNFASRDRLQHWRC
jgi:hypothetical protein